MNTAKVTHETYVITHDYNDYIVGEDGRPHAQGSHDWHPRKYAQSDKAKWHDIQRMRRHQHFEQAKRNTGQKHVKRVRYAKVGKHTWAMDATIDTRTGKVIRCHGYTNTRPPKRYR